MFQFNCTMVTLYSDQLFAKAARRWNYRLVLVQEMASPAIAELPGACYRKMPKSVLKKEKCFDFTIESSIDFKKGQILNKF